MPVIKNTDANNKFGEEVVQRERYLAAIVDIQSVLLGATEMDNLVFVSVLKSLGMVSGASRVYIFYNSEGQDGRNYASLEAEWCRPVIPPQFENPELQNIDYEKVLPGWYEILESGDSVAIIVSELAKEYQAHFSAQKIQSLLVLPFFVNGKYYGFIGFDHCELPVKWSHAEVAILRIAAAAISQTLERIQSQQALKKNEIRYRGLVESQSDLVVRIDTEGKFTFVNDAYCKMFGKRREELIGNSFIPFVYEEDLPLTLEGMKALEHPPFRASLEQRAMTAHGWRWLSWEDYAIKDDLGRTIEIQAVGRDIHKQKIIELELQREHDFVKQVISNMGQGLVVINQDHKIDFVNSAFAKMVHESETALTGASIWKYISRDDWEKIENLDNQMDRSDNVVKEMKISRINGESLFVMLSAVPMKLRESPEGTVIVVTDLTERNIVELERRKNDNFIRGIYNITSSQEISSDEKIQRLLQLGCHEFDMETGIFARVDGEIATIVDSLNATGEYPPGYSLNVRETYSYEAILAKGPIAIEHASASEWAEHPCYKIYGLESYIGVPVFISGMLYGYLSYSSKVPRVRKFRSVEKEILRLIAQWVGNEIAQQASLRQLQVSAEEIAKKNQDLAVARDQALEASRLKSEFLATMSHEIRTPLNAVIGMSELLMGTVLNEEQFEYTKIVRSSGKLLLDLINDILDFSKIEAGRLHLEKVDFELIKVVEEAVDLVVSKAKEKRIDLLAFASPKLPGIVQGDPYRLRQVLVNLVGNAIKFTEYGEVFVQAKLDYQDEEFVGVRFEVVDTGIGLSAQARKRLFHPFTQADGSTTRKYGGTGLGLAISKRIVEEMGGEIGVESEEGKGSTFWFTAQFGKTANNYETTSDLSSISDQCLRVLLANGKEKYREFFSQFLMSLGMHVSTTGTAAHALQLFDDAVRELMPFEVLVVDGDFPDLDGLSLVTRVIEQFKDHEPKVILLASHDVYQTENKFLSQPGAALLVKPIKQSVLFETIIALISGKKSLAMERKNGQKNPETSIATGVIGKKNQQSGRILIVEDNDANQRLVQAQLNKLGFEFDTASDGSMAVQLIIESPMRYRFVLMDCHMPIMDGFEATRLIRELEKGTSSHTVIVAMTANALSGDREACIQAGMDDYVSKPILLEKLAEVLGKWGFVSIEDDLLIDGDDSAYALGPMLEPRTIASIRKLQMPGEADFLTELIDMYLEDSWDLLRILEDGIRQKDLPQVKQALHNLQGISGNMGALQFARKIKNFEARIENYTFDEMNQMYAQLRLENAAVCEALQNERK